MPVTWRPTAAWMTLSHNSVPRSHETRTQAIAHATKQGVLAFRQDLHTGRIDIVYDPLTKREFTPGAWVAEEAPK